MKQIRIAEHPFQNSYSGCAGNRSYWTNFSCTGKEAVVLALFLLQQSLHDNTVHSKTNFTQNILMHVSLLFAYQESALHLPVQAHHQPVKQSHSAHLFPVCYWTVESACLHNEWQFRAHAVVY